MLGTGLSDSCVEGLPNFLSLSTIQIGAVLGFILAHEAGISTAGEFDLAFRLSGHAIAGCGAIPPRAHRSQDIAVARGPGALQNQRTVYTTVSAHNKADFHFQRRSRWNHQRIRCG